MINHWINKEKDDESLVQWCGQCCSLDSFYPTEPFINEVLHNNTYSICEFSPVVPGTMTGKITIGKNQTQTFFVKEDGTIKASYAECVVKLIGGKLKHNTAELNLEWEGDPKNFKVTINYEWECEF